MQIVYRVWNSALGTSEKETVIPMNKEGPVLKRESINPKFHPKCQTNNIGTENRLVITNVFIFFILACHFFRNLVTRMLELLTRKSSHRLLEFKREKFTIYSWFEIRVSIF